MSPARQIAQRLNARDPNPKGWWGSHCPFHDDRKPSFGFTEVGYNCKACGAHGHINQLAEHLGITVPSKKLTLADADALLDNRGLRQATIEKFGIVANTQRQAWKYPSGVDDHYRLKSFVGEGPKYWWDPEKPEGADLYGLEQCQAEDDLHKGGAGTRSTRFGTQS